MKMPKLCPTCGSRYIAAFGTGTQKVEEMVRREFPHAKYLGWIQIQLRIKVAIRK